jgi:hypothetical protein
MTIEELTKKQLEEKARLEKLNEKELFELAQKHNYETQTKGKSFELSALQLKEKENLLQTHREQNTKTFQRHGQEYEALQATKAQERKVRDGIAKAMASPGIADQIDLEAAAKRQEEARLAEKERKFQELSKRLDKFKDLSKDI